MPEATTTQVAESSTATTPAVMPAVPTDPTAYAEWRQSGKLPETKPEAKAEAKPKSEEAATSKESEGGEKSTSTEKQEPKAKTHPGAKERLDEILADLRSAGLSPAELKTFKRELKQAEPPPAKATEQTAKPAGLERPTKPKLADFESYEAYEEAQDKYHEDLSEFKVRKAVDEYRQSQAAEAQQKEIQQRMDAAQERYGEGAREAIVSTVQTIMGDAKIPDVLKDVLGDSPVLTDILYVLGSKADELAEFVALAHSKPTAAIRKIGVIESLVQAELSKGDGKQRGEDGKFAAKAETKAPEKKTPEVPPPPKELSGRGSIPTDEVENALKTGDFRAFKAAQDRRDIAKIRGH